MFCGSMDLTQPNDKLIRARTEFDSCYSHDHEISSSHLKSDHRYQVVRLEYVLVLMDTVTMLSQFSTIANRFYRTLAQYSIHLLGNVNDTLSSGS